MGLLLKNLYFQTLLKIKKTPQTLLRFLENEFGFSFVIPDGCTCCWRDDRHKNSLKMDCFLPSWLHNDYTKVATTQMSHISTSPWSHVCHVSTETFPEIGGQEIKKPHKKRRDKTGYVWTMIWAKRNDTGPQQEERTGWNIMNSWCHQVSYLSPDGGQSDLLDLLLYLQMSWMTQSLMKTMMRWWSWRILICFPCVNTI